MYSTTATDERATQTAAKGTAQLLAVLDGAAPLGYLVFGDPVAIQIAALCIKLSMLVLSRRPLYLQRVEVAFLVIIAIFFVQGSVVDMFGGVFDDVNEMRYLAFLLSSATTLLLLDYRCILSYCSVIGFLCSAFSGLHIFLVATGGVINNFGRYFYLGNTHPNLGGEISAVAAIAIALLPFRVLHFLAISVLLVSCLLMQSRSAVVVIGAVLAIRLLSAGWKHFGVSGRAVALIVAAISICALMLDPTALEYISRNVLLLDDIHRGLGTGLVGRDERWSLALYAFSEDPIFGKGLSAVDAMGGLGFHNGVMYGLALHGIFSLALWFIVARQILLAFRTSAVAGLIIFTGGFLVLFNDRFVNLNLYPFVFYILVLKYPQYKANEHKSVGGANVQ